MNESTQHEIHAIVARYSRRKAQQRDGRAQLLAPHRHLSHQEKERAFLRVFRQRWTQREIPTLRVLEVGCGHGDNLLQFVRWGFTPENLLGNELLEDRCAIARQRLPGDIRVVPGDASTLDLPPASFDIVLQSTVFTSILDRDFQHRLAESMWSLLRPSGVVLWYDFAFDNPRNPDVKGVRRSTIRALFPHGRMQIAKVTLAPPIARAVTKINPSLYALFNAVPLLRTHLFCVIEKPAAASELGAHSHAA